MNHIRIRQTLAIATILLLGGALAPAQTQPPQAGNQQDEIVNITLQPHEGADRVLEILRSGDKFETNKYITRAIELFHVHPYEIKPYITDGVVREKGFVRGAFARPDANGNNRKFLVVTTTRDQMPSIEETIKTLDDPNVVNGQGRTRHAWRLQYRRASEVGTLLAQTRGSSQSKIIPDDLTNTLYFDDSASAAAALETFVKFYDVPAPQVEFDVQIIEIREQDSGTLGLDWDSWKRNVGGQFSFSGTHFENGIRWGRLDALLTLDAVFSVRT